MLTEFAAVKFAGTVVPGICGGIRLVTEIR
jgi:hypothetical protein